MVLLAISPIGFEEEPGCNNAFECTTPSTLSTSSDPDYRNQIQVCPKRVVTCPYRTHIYLHICVGGTHYDN